MPKLRHLAWGAMTLAASIAAAAPARAEPEFSRLVVFGDSLSDMGNAGRFTNGPVWVEHVAQGLKADLAPSRAGGGNHAVGGARADDLRMQADLYLAAGRPDPAALHIVWGGANDLLAAGEAMDGRALAEEAAATVGGIVADLAAAGARHILVLSLPDIGVTPAVGARGPAVAAAARQLSLAYNARLEQALARVEAEAGITIRRLDMLALADRVLADPAAFGFVNVTEPCHGGDCAGHLFWDGIHPSAAAHARLAAVVLEGLGVER